MFLFPRDRSKRGFMLIELLVVMVIIAILAAVVYNVYIGGKKSADGKRTVTPKTRALDVNCKSNLSQVRSAIEMAKQMNEDEKPPASLDEMRDLSSIRSCPDGKEPYLYDSQSGRVSCPHPGHENL